MSNLKNAYALLIGIGNDLPVTVHDATAINNILADEKLAGYDQNNIILVTGKDATRNGILDAFDLLISKIDEDSSVFLFYSGHGGLYEPWNQFYLVPNNFDPEEYESTWVKAEELKEKISAINSKKLVFFLDCCHAAGMTKSAPLIGKSKVTSKIHLENADGLAQKLDDGKGMSIISSCREDQLSYIMDGDNNSLFTKCLIEVLKGKHKPEFKEPYVRISEVISHIFKSVPERNPEQKPYANLQIYDDFALSFIPNNVLTASQQNLHIDLVEKSKEGKEKIAKTVYRSTDSAKKAIIFVHGFTGEAADSFGIIPDLLLEDKEYNDWNLYPLGFSEFVKPTLGKNIWAATEDIEKVADYLQTSIKYKFGTYENIAIIAHSLGGLVVQKALTKLTKTNLDRISHVLLFASPNNGISSSFLAKLWNKHLSDFNQKGKFIQSLRKDWDEKFSTNTPFIFKAIAASHDQYIPVKSNIDPFNNEFIGTIAGDHFSIVQPSDKNCNSYLLLKEVLSNQSDGLKQPQIVDNTSNEIVENLLPNCNQLDKRGLEKLIFALEGLNRSEEAITILERHPLLKSNSDLLGIIGGRYKRKYLLSYLHKDGIQAIKYYNEGIVIAKKNEDYQQTYYLQINLAFLNLLVDDNIRLMKKFANDALASCEKDSFDSLWKYATIAEANLYLGNLELAKQNYSEASLKANRREKISIYSNAYTGYICLTSNNNEEDEFIRFIKTSFLN